MEEKIFFESEDGVKLCGILTTPEKKTDKVIILAHGITVEKNEGGIFTGLANLLAENGFAVFRFDFRGHGESEGDSVEMTLTGELKDLSSAVQQVKEKGYSDIGLVGASYGGGITSLFMPSHQSDIKAVSFWNPVLNYDHCFLNPTLPWIKDRKQHMKSDIAEKGWTILGSHGFKIGKALYAEMAEFFPYKELQNISIPMQIIHGDKDTKVPYEDSLEYSKDLKNIEFLTIEGAEHGFHETETQAQQANKATLDFFKKYL